MTEFNFTLPHGLIGDFGKTESLCGQVREKIYRQGTMRLATARDEITVQNDPRIKENPAYAVLIYLSLVITSLEDLSNITPQLLENLSVLDLAYLREFYNRINQHREAHISLQCPHCQQQLAVELALAGEL
jgi:hypothetical protein